MSRTRKHGCGQTRCSMCKHHKRYPRKNAKRAQYDKPSARRTLQERVADVASGA